MGICPSDEPVTSLQDQGGCPTLSSWRELSPESKVQSWLSKPPTGGAGNEFTFLEIAAHKLLLGAVVHDNKDTSHGF